MESNFVVVKNLKKHFPVKSGVFHRASGQVRAVDGVSLCIKKGKTFGLVGESGCGKTTLGRTILRLLPATSGSVFIGGTDIFAIKSKKRLRELRPGMQMIFQDPYLSLNPRIPACELIGEAVREHSIVPARDYRDHVKKTMEDCGLPPGCADRYPHEFSGGQRQRICIARALALRPGFIVADEPVSALDVSIQAQILNLLQDLQEQRGITYLFISHDLSVVEFMADVVGVMYLGRLVELGPKRDIFENPAHPYTLALRDAVPAIDPAMRKTKILLPDGMPSAVNPPTGCAFHTRCERCQKLCRETPPAWSELAPGHFAACHYL